MSPPSFQDRRPWWKSFFIVSHILSFCVRVISSGFREGENLRKLDVRRKTINAFVRKSSLVYSLRCHRIFQKNNDENRFLPKKHIIRIYDSEFLFSNFSLTPQFREYLNIVPDHVCRTFNCSRLHATIRAVISFWMNHLREKWFSLLPHGNLNSCGSVYIDSDTNYEVSWSSATSGMEKNIKISKLYPFTRRSIPLLWRLGKTCWRQISEHNCLVYSAFIVFSKLRNVRLMNICYLVAKLWHFENRT